MNLSQSYKNYLLTGRDGISPTSKDRYVGIEIEFLSKKAANYYELKDLVVKYLDDSIAFNCVVTSDSSVKELVRDSWGQEVYKYGGELCVLVPEKELRVTLKKLSVYLKKIEAYVNDSCGLHVHLDMRSRDKRACSRKLNAALPFLRKLIPSKRRTNPFCSGRGKYRAINDSTQYQTIEVRLHQGTVDMEEVYNWVRVLTNLVDDKIGVTSKGNVSVRKTKPSVARPIKSYVQEKVKQYA